MTIALIPSQKYRFSAPWTDEHVEQLDEMLEDLFKGIRLSAIGGAAGTLNNLSGFVKGDVLYASDAVGTISGLAAVASGSVLASNGVLSAPTWNAAPTLSTSLTTPLIIGGTAAGSTLTLRSTSGVGAGTAAAIIFQVGNNGGTEVLQMTNDARMISGNPTTPLSGANTFTWASASGQTVGRFESKTTGATQGAFINLQSNTGGVYEVGVFLGNVAGKAILLSNNVNRLVISKTDYLMALGDDLTASYPALKRSTTDLQFRLGDDSAFTNFVAKLGTHSFTSLALTSTDGVVLENTTASTGGVTVQTSPRIRLRGTAWDTAASETVDFIEEVLPATGATVTGTWRLRYSVNGAAYANALTAETNGTVTAAVALASGGNVRAGGPGTAFIYWNTLSTMSAPSDGVILLANNAVTDFSRLQFGGTTSSFPALKRSTTSLQVRLADDSAYSNLDALSATVFGATSGSAALSTEAVGGNFLRITGSGAGSGVNMMAGSPGSVNSRNWGLFTNFTNYGDLELMYSTTSSGSPVGANILLSFRSNGLVCFGGDTTSFPALKPSGAALSVRLADDSADANLLAKSVRGVPVTFANVPGTPVHGMLVAVTDSTTVVWGATITGGGANKVIAGYNGTNWTVVGI